MTAKKKRTKTNKFDLSGEGPKRLAKIITCLQGMEVGLIDKKGISTSNLFPKDQYFEVFKLIKKMTKKQTEFYMRLGGIGKFAPKDTRPPKCPYCSHRPTH